MDERHFHPWLFPRKIHTDYSRAKFQSSAGRTPRYIGLTHTTVASGRVDTGVMPCHLYDVVYFHDTWMDEDSTHIRERERPQQKNEIGFVWRVLRDCIKPDQDKTPILWWNTYIGFLLCITAYHGNKLEI